MSNFEKSENENSVDTPTKNISNLLASTLGLKDSNPKVFFGGIVAIVALVLIVIISFGSSNNLPHAVFKNLVVGQQYTLKGANSTDEKSTISMVAVPGLAAFDDNEDDDSDRSCKQQPKGTLVKILDLQDFAGKKSAFAQVEILTKGDCQGRKGWVFTIDIQ